MRWRQCPHPAPGCPWLTAGLPGSPGCRSPHTSAAENNGTGMTGPTWPCGDEFPTLGGGSSLARRARWAFSATLGRVTVKPCSLVPVERVSVLAPLARVPAMSAADEFRAIASQRWLRNQEVYELLSHWNDLGFCLSRTPALQPPSTRGPRSSCAGSAPHPCMLVVVRWFRCRGVCVVSRRVSVPL